MKARNCLMPYRLIVSDMDDTLLNERGLLSPATIEAIVRRIVVKRFTAPYCIKKQPPMD